MTSRQREGAHESPRLYRFGIFELDVRSGELRRRGVRLKLQDKPLKVLLALLEHPGEVVTRDELRHRLWTADVFVDFESGLNTAANRLRLALGDSAEHPRYIETLARNGYRFIAPVDVVHRSATPLHDDVKHGRDALVLVPTASVAAQLDSPAATHAAFARPTRRIPRMIILSAAAFSLLGAFIVTVVAVRQPVTSEISFRPVTFRRGEVTGARFAPDGRSVLYSATWDNGPRQLFVTSPLSPESRPIGFDDMSLAAISRSGELALMSSDGTMPIAGGSVSRVPMNGGLPKPAEQHVMSVDWTADGQLAVARAVDGTNRLEWPAGRVVHSTSGWISNIRVSAKGDRVAFIEHPVRHDNRGTLMIGERNAARDDVTVRALASEWAVAGGLAWSPSDDELFMTATRDATPKSLWAVSLDGLVRPLAHIAGALTLRDVAHDGTVLASRDTVQLEMALLEPTTGRVRDLSWLDWSRVVDISPDGRMVLFDETGTGGGPQSLAYVRRLDDDSAIRLGEGIGLALSPDGRSALTVDAADRTRLRQVPIDGGRPSDVPPNGLEYQWVQFFPDGRRMLVQASEPERPLRLYVVDDAFRARPLTPPDTVRNAAIAPDGRQVAVLGSDGTLRLYPVESNSAAVIVPTDAPLAPILWTLDRGLLVQRLGRYTQIPTALGWLDIPTGRTLPWVELRPRDAAGVNAITKVMVSANTRVVIFNYRRVLSELFVATAPTR